MVSERIKNRELMDRVMDASTVVRIFFTDGMSVAFSGMAGTAVPKEIPKYLAEFSKERRDKLKLKSLVVSGTTTNSFEEQMTNVDVKSRFLIAGGGVMKERINRGAVDFFDFWLSEYSRVIRDRIIPEGGLDIAVIEATHIDEKGHIIPSLSLDNIPAIVDAAKKIIVEINTSKPVLNGVHDVYVPEPHSPIPIRNVSDRVGTPYLKVPESKIAAIVISEAEEEYAAAYQAPTKLDVAIARNVIDFLEKSGVMKKKMVIQAGVGPLASTLIEELPLKDVSVWTEVAPVKWALAVPEKINALSTACLYTLKGEEKLRDEFYETFRERAKNIVIRPYEVTNSLEIISRLQLVCIQQALEVDLYGNVNVSHLNGKIHNGVGGSGDFTRAAYLTAVALTSTASDGRFSRIVPFTLHTDVTEHDVDVVVTEHGWVDLRGLPPRRRAKLIIEKCAHPDFREELQEYLRAAEKLEGHSPVDLAAYMDFQKQVLKTGR
ncbi:MAG: hypothetical protein NZ941_05545 [Candidatus Caldarchaeum sp.]|nr:hypothetical protein [Candidatus Caldarchaeum sp.]